MTGHTLLLGSVRVWNTNSADKKDQCQSANLSLFFSLAAVADDDDGQLTVRVSHKLISAEVKGTSLGSPPPRLHLHLLIYCQSAKSTAIHK